MKNAPINEILKQELTDEQIKDLWYDWFCKDSSLANRGRSLIKKLKRVTVANNNKFDADKCYTFFKNNCPLRGNLYDDFRICDIKTGDVVFTVIPSSGFEYKKGKAELWGKCNNFQEAILEDVTFKEIVNWFKN